VHGTIKTAQILRFDLRDVQTHVVKGFSKKLQHTEIIRINKNGTVIALAYAFACKTKTEKNNRMGRIMDVLKIEPLKISDLY